jgi:hypothetical protein
VEEEAGVEETTGVDAAEVVTPAKRASSCEVRVVSSLRDVARVDRFVWTVARAVVAVV